MSLENAHPFKIKVGTALKKESVQRLKELARNEARSMGEILDSAIEQYANRAALAEERLHRLLHPGWKMTLEEIQSPVEDEMYGE